MNTKEHRLREATQSAISKWGLESQLWVTMEECAELIQAITRYLRGRWDGPGEIQEELADLEVMIDCLRGHFGDGVVDEWKYQKVERLEARVKYSERTF